MRRNNISILTIILISSILRFYKLGSVPEGLSLDEVKTGLFLSKVTPLFFEPFFLRLFFAALGILSVYLFYLICKKYFNFGLVPIISSFFVAILPWHIQESRVLSKPMIVFLLVQIIVLILPKGILTSSKNKRFTILLLLIGFVVSLLIPHKGITDLVNNDRHLTSLSSPILVSKIFVNKFVYNYKVKEKLIFENFDFGTYFFSGHPRERWGVEESQKFYLFMIPLFIFGILKIKSVEKIFLFNYVILSVLLFTYVNFSNMVLILPIIVLASYGLQNYKKTAFLWLAVFCIVLAVYEVINFSSIYFSNLNKSLFSPRRTVYEQLVLSIKKTKSSDSKVLVNDVMGDPKDYFKYYLKNNVDGYEFRSFNILKEELDKNIIYVDSTPKEAGPSEPLYKKDGKWPSIINIIAEFDDFEKRSVVLVYKIK